MERFMKVSGKGIKGVGMAYLETVLGRYIMGTGTVTCIMGRGG
jgi:hypothetical protein